ncbi:alpha/beta hydrolase [Treponema bryantii]|uniref:alpha/beta hydrolase n=1 Tax=Treponema bryantii TaxID=163 RepID=UPI002B3184DC|nr:alpha-xylosidase [Treponema bryantii]
MSVYKCEFYAMSFSRKVPFVVVSPNDLPQVIMPQSKRFNRKPKTVLLLNGYSSSEGDWVFNTPLPALAVKYNVNFVVPAGENSFYLNQKSSTRKYADYVGFELLQFCNKAFGFDISRENTIVAGLSMGGFGALHTGLAYTDKFSKIIALSSALIIHNIKNIKPGFQDMISSYEYYDDVFGPLDELEASEKNPETLIRNCLEKNIQMPEIYMAIGTEDFLYKENQLFRQFLTDNKVPFTYKEEPGIHDYSFWNKHLDLGLEWALGNEE